MCGAFESTYNSYRWLSITNLRDAIALLIYLFRLDPVVMNVKINTNIVSAVFVQLPGSIKNSVHQKPIVMYIVALSGYTPSPNGDLVGNAEKVVVHLVPFASVQYRNILALLFAIDHGIAARSITP